MAAPQSTWAQLRQQARAQETQTESLFHTYSHYANSADLDPQSSDDERRTEEQLNDILDKRASLLATLSRQLDSDPAPPSALKTTNLARHREILHQHRTQLATLKSSIASARDRANLLSHVRSDIASYRNPTTANADPNAAEADYMLSERGRLDRSHGVVDGVLSQAYAVNEQFGLQRETLGSIQRRITASAAQVPGINGLMARIGSKKRRDGIILGSFIAVCFLVVLWFW